jgi:OmcA/MtrC family decaheme c-type cytochrome
VFHALAGGNLSILRSYVQGDDYIGNPSTGTSPGQPGSAPGVTTTNTTCTGNVATTTVNVEAVPAGTTRGIVAIQGKPRVVAVDPADTDGVMSVRAKTPTREWVIGSGAEPAEPRRAIADTDQCLKCHVGSLYQHGGNRVDNVTMCVMCHNAASSEKNVRVGWGVEASEAYDGKTGETYEFKTMLHKVHSAGIEGQNPFVIYRTNQGIFAWAPEGTMLPNWPGTGSQTVYGAVDASGNPVVRNHSFHSPTYPRLLDDCGACHVADFNQVPEQSKAVALTTEAGVAPWGNQLDDTLQGAGAAACTSCHQSSSTRGHAIQNGWEPKTFPNGRQTILDAAD